MDGRRVRSSIGRMITPIGWGRRKAPGVIRYWEVVRGRRGDARTADRWIDRGAEADEQRLHELGYKQELSRAWSGFTNFAISFTIISVLAGTLHDVRVRLAERRPDRDLDRLAGALLLRPDGGLLDGRADLARIPTAGGPYWWAHDLGGKGWSWMTGWFNIVGLIGIVASVGLRRGDLPQHPARPLRAEHLRHQLRRHAHILTETFLLFLIILALYTLVNIFADRFLALINNISVGWHVLGVAVIIGAPDLRPRPPPERQLRLRRADQQHRLRRRLHQRPRLLVPGPADRLPADDVHADGLRRLRPHRRGDAGRRDGGRAGRLAVGRSSRR